MNLAEITQKKNAKVTVRVPVAMQKTHGLKESAVGKVVGVRLEGRIARVKVALRSGKTFEFRPQDLSLA